ncbi:ribosome assembly cofactor RimP [Prochlorococcus marinus]|uniref:ribosome assembly cofactor RimP n=1 Tax=Prochlorococcus marinus TaxID=1219 RepID=UPI0022B432D4|nr:ribosome assembly cofactor RimP [Prochlorococcus marinus]
MSNQLVRDLEHLAGQTASKEGYQIVGLHVLANTNPMTIQVQIRQKDGTDVSLDDCSGFSFPMETAIENSNLFKASYILEISSPGLSDILKTDKEFETFKGFPIEVSTKNKENIEVIQSGLLHTRSKDHLLINNKGKVSKIPRENVIQVRLASPTG